VTAGQTATFTVLAAGTPHRLGYQWQKELGQHRRELLWRATPPDNDHGDSGATFAVVVSNTAGTVTSSAGDTDGEPRSGGADDHHPAGNQTVTTGQTATFTVLAAGTALGYQWQKNSVNIAGATLASYTTPTTTTADSGATFAVVVSNTAGR